MGHSKKQKDKNENKTTKDYVKEKLRAMKKQSKKNKHRARLIVRNLPFAVTQDNLRAHFEQYGEVDEVKILKKEDGQVLGCGFVQFKLVQSAAKARHYMNGKPFLDREIECDWALPKDKYQQLEKVDDVEIKEEPIDEGYDAHEIKSEPIKEETEEQPAEHMETDADEGENVKHKEDEEEEDHDEDDNVSDEDEDVKDDESSIEDVTEVEEKKFNTTRPKVESNDTVEGKTVFIKNVPFSATNADLKECLSKFGPLYYALVCIDPLTEHSKGTAFVKFRNKEDAEKCLDSANITLMGNLLDCQRALPRGEVSKKPNDKSKPHHKDSRNLYLVKEGVILAGSKAAEGVSASDMAKRLQLEQYKTSMLRNLNMIVARTRLVIHNIPPGWDDSKLRSLIVKHVGPKEFIKEARIMRNMKVLDSKGIGKSKEFGFVTFKSHETALQVLRAINNNPHIFSPNKRPIVAFSIENRARLLTKQKRLHNSQIKNPNYKHYDPKAKVELKSEPIVNTEDKPGEWSEFTGVTATPGVKKMRSKFNLKTQAKIHHEQLKKEKKNKKHAKKTLKEKRAEFTKQPRQKINKNKNKEKDNFSKLVNQYKAQLFGSSIQTEIKKKKKWFNEV